MADSGNKQRRRSAVRLADILGPVLDPVVARQGFARADLIATWASLAGPLYADCTQPEKITWPREKDEAGRPLPGILTLRVDGPKAIFVQHDLPQIVERINAFLGYAAIGRIRIIQAAVARKNHRGRAGPTELSAGDGQAVSTATADVPDERLRAALDRLGRAVYQARLKQT